MTSASPAFRPYSGDSGVCSSPLVAELHRHWRSLCRDGLLPSRQAIDPADIKSLLPFVLIMDVEAEPLRVRYRLVGTAIAALSRRDITGLWLDEIQFDRARERATFEAGYRLLLESRAPVFGRLVWSAFDDFELLYESAIFPLASDGRSIDKAIAVEHYLHADPGAVAERVPTRQLRRKRP